MSKTKREYVENKIQDQVKPETLEWVKNRYLPFLKRQGLSDGTESNRLQALSKLLLIEELRPETLENKTEKQIRELGEKVAGNIQANEYVEQGSSGMSKRRKRLIWTCFKNIVKLEGFDTDKLPDFKPKETDEVQRRARDTDPEKIPSPEQVKQFVQAMGKYSSDIHKLRNQSLILLMWDKGPRIGEALNIQLKDCSIDNDQLEIFIEGNKGSEDRTVTIYQGRETLKEFIRTHPGNKQDYLFSDLMHRNLDTPVGRDKIGGKIKQVAAEENFQFKTEGEPNHIFRKAMTTSHIVNEWATWEEVCKLQGKKGDSTKPAYLKMALNDVNKSVGQKIGAVGDQEERDFHMLGEPLLPQKCVSCGKINKCFVETCQYCSGNLKTPEKSAFQKTEEEVREEAARYGAQIAAKAEVNPDQTLNEIKEQILNQQEEDTP